MSKIVIAAFSILLLTGYAGGLSSSPGDTSNSSSPPLADTSGGKWGTLTVDQADVTIQNRLEIAQGSSLVFELNTFDVGQLVAITHLSND